MDNKDAIAMVFKEAERPFTPYAIQLPIPADGDVVVEVEYATICSSDLHTYFGRRKAHTPSILGHEIIGRISALSTFGAKDFHGNKLKIGDRVTWSVYAHDHQGEMAKKGIPQKSADLFKYGHEALGEKKLLSGGFATHCHLRHGTDIYKLSQKLTPKEAAPLNCTHATMAGALRLAGSLEGKNVMVIGVGMLGLSGCAMAREAGAAKVFAMDIVENRMQKALQFGTDLCLHAETPDDELKARLKEFGGVDVIFESSGIPASMEKGLDLLNIGGINVWVGAVFSQRDLAINAENLVRNILTIKGLHNYIPLDLAKAIDFLTSNHLKYPFGDLVDMEFPLQKLGLAFDTGNKKGHYRVGVNPML